MISAKTEIAGGENCGMKITIVRLDFILVEVKIHNSPLKFFVFV